MPSLERFQVYDNDEMLRETIEKALAQLIPEGKRVYLVNISYALRGRERKLFSGMRFIVDLRMVEEDATPVIFYGYEDKERLKKNSEASVLKSPGIEYIRIPFSLNELKDKIDAVFSDSRTSGLDPQTRRNNAVVKIKAFKHDIKNTANTVEIVFKLKRDVSETARRKNWENVRKALFQSADLIEKRILQFDKISGELEDILMSAAITEMGADLREIAIRYGALLNSLGEYSEKGVTSAISSAEQMICKLYEIILVLEDIKE